MTLLNVGLRAVSLSDEVHVLRLYTHSKVRQYLGGALSEKQAQIRWAQFWTEESSSFYWAVIRQSDNAFMGQISLVAHHNPEHTELSYLFFPEFWGQGYAQETLRSIIEYAFREMGLDALLAETQTENHASCQLLERLGMSLEQKLTRFGAEQSIYILSSENKA